MYTFRKDDNPNISVNIEPEAYRKYKSKRNNSLPDMPKLLRSSL